MPGGFGRGWSSGAPKAINGRAAGCDAAQDDAATVIESTVNVDPKQPRYLRAVIEQKSFAGAAELRHAEQDVPRLKSARAIRRCAISCSISSVPAPRSGMRPHSAEFERSGVTGLTKFSECSKPHATPAMRGRRACCAPRYFET
jgi:hypothetical protein